MAKEISLKLSEIADGGLQEKFENEMKRVAENIQNPNTDAKKKRKISIEIELAPSDNRDSVQTSYQVKSKLVPEESVSSTLLVGKTSSGKTVVNELKSGAKGQTYFDAEDEKLKDDTGNEINENGQVIDLQKKAGK